MSRATLSVTDVLDEACEVVPRVAAPFVGLLWLTSLPWRLAQDQFAAHLLALKGEASQFGHGLTRRAVFTGLAFLLAVWGRAVYVRACGLGLRGTLVDRPLGRRLGGRRPRLRELPGDARGPPRPRRGAALRVGQRARSAS